MSAILQRIAAACQQENGTCSTDADCCNNGVCDGKCLPCLGITKNCNAKGKFGQSCCPGLLCNAFNGKCDACNSTGACTIDSHCCSNVCLNQTCYGTPAPTNLRPTFAPTLYPTRQPTTLYPTHLPSNSPIQVIATKPNDSPPTTQVTPGGAAVFVTAILALAGLFLFVRRRARPIRFKNMHEVRKNRKFASRKSITTFMNKMEKSKEDCFIDPKKLELGRVIGVGSHGVVYEGSYSGKKVAIKELVLEEDENEAKDSRQRFLQEMIALHRLSHPNIIRLIGVGALYAEDSLSKTFFFVMELAQCSLRDIMQDDNLRSAISSLPKSLGIAKQIGSGLAYMHSMDLM
jgi:hypothetical protein